MIPAYLRVAALMCVSLLATACGAPSVEVSDARVRALLPDQDKTVGYLRISNPTSAPFTLSAASSPDVRAIEMHTTRRDGDVLRMRRLSSVEVPAGGEIVFESGGHHLMLFGVGELGPQVEITLTSSEGQALTVNFDVVDPTQG